MTSAQRQLLMAKHIAEAFINGGPSKLLVYSCCSRYNPQWIYWAKWKPGLQPPNSLLTNDRGWHIKQTLHLEKWWAEDGPCQHREVEHMENEHLPALHSQLSAVWKKSEKYMSQHYISVLIYTIYYYISIVIILLCLVFSSIMDL